MPANPRKYKADHQSNGSANYPDQNPLRNENSPDLRLACSHRHEDSNVARLLHDHHGERDQDIQRSHKDDQPDGNEGDQSLQPERAEESLILLHPVGGHEARASCFLNLVRDLTGFVDVVDLELEY